MRRERRTEVETEKKVRVLVIDDERGFCYFARKNLQDSGPFEVLIATDPKEGLLLAQREKPDLILLDVMMPQMDGFELLDRLKKNLDTATIPVLMLTAVGDPQVQRSAASFYNDGYIVKPVTFEVLRSRIDAVLQRIGKKVPS